VTFQEQFFERVGIELDPFQLDAIGAIDAGESVLVSAPTGSGKTLVGLYGAALALAQGRRAFYTTPLKALSNQKFHEFSRFFGTDQVGLLTGDNSINKEAPVVVMTTEVLRNMIYAEEERLTALGLVVLDEVHYLQNPYRGAVWEEVIVHLPREVRLVCLSATVSNAEEVGGWLREVRGQMTVVETRGRPVPLEHQYLFVERRTREVGAVPVSHGGRPNPHGLELDPPWLASSRRARAPKVRGANRVELVEYLAANRQLPAIVFIFSRAGCEDALGETLAGGLRLTTERERSEIRELIDRRLQRVEPEELKVLGFAQFAAGLEAGLAAHHAGLVPPFREIVEACFEAALVKVVFATETLSLGINMPARAVVIDRMMKFDGESHKLLTPGEYTQFAGRAGRRGIDTRGTSYVNWGPNVSFRDVARVVEGEFFPITSSFRPTYNMVANLVRRYRIEAAKEMLNLSFAQYLKDRDVVRLEAELRTAKRRTSEAVLARPTDPHELGPGTVVSVPAAGTRRRRAYLVVTGVIERPARPLRIQSVSASGRPYALGQVHLAALRVHGHVTLPEVPGSRKWALRKEIARALRQQMRNRHREEPAPEFLESGIDPSARVRDQDRIGRLEQRIQARRGALSEQLDRVLEVMEHFDCTRGWSLTPRGERVASLYAESDLLVALTLDDLGEGELTSAELAALLSWFTFEPRPSFRGSSIGWHSEALAAHFERVQERWVDLERREAALRLPLTRAPEPGLGQLIAQWANGRSIERVLKVHQIPPGDFIRNAKQVADLARQVQNLGMGTWLGRLAGDVERKVVRGIVAVSSEVPSLEEVEFYERLSAGWGLQ